MKQTLQEPQQQISPHAVKVWRISNLIENIVILVIVTGLLFLQNQFNWYAWIGIVLYIIIALAILNGLFETSIEPVYLRRTWRYEIGEQHIQIKQGLFNKHHLVVPMTKVQYVNTNQGPLLRKYGLSTITIGTIASSHEIPAIAEEKAAVLRNKIAQLAKINETDT